MKRHGHIDERSLAFGRAIAGKLVQHPELVQRARATVTRWMTVSSPRTSSTLQEWLAALDGPLAPVVALLTSTDERATRLRQSNPFAGVLSQQERNAILRRFQKYDTAAI
jgi:hypothetical protein